MPPNPRSWRSGAAPTVENLGPPTHECASCAADEWTPQWHGFWEPCWVEPSESKLGSVDVLFLHRLSNGTHRRQADYRCAGPAALMRLGCVRGRL